MGLVGLSLERIAEIGCTDSMVADKILFFS